MSIDIRVAEKVDLAFIAKIYTCCFPREKQHADWINANFLAFPKTRYYVVVVDGAVVGYALWAVKSGFRDHSIVELEQLAIMPEHRACGLGRKILEYSFAQFKQHLAEQGVGVKAIYLTTRDGNNAEHLYRNVLGVEREAVIKNYGSGDELILFKHFM